MKLEITKQKITAKTRYLKAHWTLETAKDFKMATTPWQYVKNWSWSDKGPHDSLEDLNKRMQNRWPGNYQIVAKPRWNGHNCYINEHEFKFNSPKDETWFRIKYS